MRQIHSLLRSVGLRTLRRRAMPGVRSPAETSVRVARPLYIATSVLVIARHRRAGVSVIDAREAIEHLAATRWPTREERELREDLVHATGLQVDELAELAKEWLPW